MAVTIYGLYTITTKSIAATPQTKQTWMYTVSALLQPKFIEGTGFSSEPQAIAMAKQAIDSQSIL